jgi:transposase-like protein
VYKHRFLIVKRTENLTERDWDNLCQMFDYLPELRPLWYFCREVYQMFSTEQVIRLARRRRTLLLKKASYQEVPELVKAMGLLEGDKFDKMVAFLESSEGARVRTNNHVERTNRKLRYDEKVRYKFRTERSLDRFLRLRLDLLARQGSCAKPLPATTAGNRKADPSTASKPGGD